MTTSTSVHEIKTLISSQHPVLLIETVEEERVRSLLASVASQLRMAFFEWSVTQGLTKVGEGERFNRMTAKPQDLLGHLQSLQVEAIFLVKDFIPFLNTPEMVRVFRDLAQKLSKSRSTVVLTGESLTLPPEIAHMAVSVKLHLPDRDEMEAVLNALLGLGGTIDRLGLEIAPGEREELLRALQGFTLNQARQALARVLLDGKLTKEDFQTLIHQKAQAIREGGLLEFYPAEDNSYQLGGFSKLKAWLQRARAGFSREAKDLNLKPPKGILIVGVPGCGKSLAAKCIAREWRLPLLKLDAASLYDKFVGESEKNLRKAMLLAESVAPVVLWIDEIEKGFVQTGSGDADGGLSRRIFGTFLTWMQEKKEEVFLVATANDLSILPPELLRKGRFDEIFFVDLPDPKEREEIFRIHLELRKQNPASFGLGSLAKGSEGFSGAEIEQALVGALYQTLHLKKKLDEKLLLEELRQVIPLSVSRAEDIARLRETARGRFVPVR